LSSDRKNTCDTFKYQQKIFVMKIICFLIWVLVSGLLFLSSCRKDKFVTVNDQTFGCKVNGKPFIADDWDYGYNIPPLRIDFWYSPVLKNVEVQIIGKKQNQFVEIWLASPVVAGRTYLKTTTLPHPCLTHPTSYGLYQKYYPDKSYITNSNIGGFVDIISVDTIAQKIEGRFEFIGTDQATGNTVSVTNGYFKRN
jgi:hypothetical protein